MEDLFDEKEFNKATAYIFSNGGNLVYNHTVRKLCSILFARYSLNNKQLIKEFKSWFYSKELDKKWRPELCSLKTFTLSCVRIFLLKTLKEKDDYAKKTVPISDVKYPVVSYSGSGCVKYNGKWTQIQSMCFNTQEDDYMLAELEYVIAGFNVFKGYNDVYLHLFAGEIKVKEAAELLGVSRITVVRAMTKYKLDLYEYLGKLGYCYEDLCELYEKKN